MPPSRKIAPPSRNPSESGDQGRVVAAQSETVRLSAGPIPSPDELAGYEKVYPGLARIIIDSFEAEYKNRQHIERIAMEGDIEAMRLSHADVARGQRFGVDYCDCRNGDWRGPHIPSPRLGRGSTRRGRVGLCARCILQRGAKTI